MITISKEDRVKFLNLDATVHISDKLVILREEQKLGYAKLIVHLTYPHICFLNADKQTLGYLKTLRCADAILFGREGEQRILKILEFKKCMTVESLKKSLSQFEGALYNAMVIASFLKIDDFDEIRLYSAYRYDKIDENPYSHKIKENQIALRQWRAGKVKLPYVDIEVPYKRIVLDEQGEGEVEL